MYPQTTLDTKYGPLVVWATSAHHIGARLGDESEPDAAQSVTLYGVEYSRARVDAFTVHPGERGGFMLDDHDREHATYTAGTAPMLATSYHGYGVMMHRAAGGYPDDPTEAAAHAFRREVLERLAEYAATPAGALLMARGAMDAAIRKHDTAEAARVKAYAEERAARAAMHAAGKVYAAAAVAVDRAAE
jgi:hypothetical protein